MEGSVCETERVHPINHSKQVLFNPLCPRRDTKWRHNSNVIQVQVNLRLCLGHDLHIVWLTEDVSRSREQQSRDQEEYYFRDGLQYFDVIFKSWGKEVHRHSISMYGLSTKLWCNYTRRYFGLSWMNEWMMRWNTIIIIIFTEQEQARQIDSSCLPHAITTKSN